MSSGFLLLSTVLLAPGCDPATTFDVPLEGETNIQGSGLVGELLGTFPGFDSLSTIDVSESDEFENNNASKEQVREARVTRFTLSVTEPPGNSFDFLDEIAFFVGSPGLDTQRIGSREVPEGSMSFELELDDVDLGPYVRAETMTFTTEASGRQPQADTTVLAELILQVTVGALE